MYDISTQEPIVRIIKEQDLERIIEIDNKVLGERRSDYWESKLTTISKSPLPSLVAEMEGTVVGFIFGEASGWEYGVPENIGWIDTIGVDPDYQKKGIGRLLINELLNYMKKVGVDTVYTFVNWRDWDLLRFFNAMGFNRGDMINLKFKIED
ncbi:MAG: GNAT family N-acetyltransferase [Candidatus Heimdallarchaeota archaeon]|nr:MAG: GNAT family N-acetyltransferase [Candidatus Heimdallarchaeota archaeon]